MNKVILKGNLVAKPESRTVGAKNIPLTKFRLAVNEGKKTTFIDVETWEKTAQNCEKYLDKGSPVLVDGRLALDSWDDKQGQKRSRHFVVGHAVEFLGKLNATDEDRDQAADPTKTVEEGDEVPF